MQFLRRAEYGAVFLIALWFYALSGASWWLFILCFFVPDLAMLGYVFGNRAGAVIYNSAHSFLGVIVLAVFIHVFDQEWLWPYLLIWFAHIAFDRMLGYGLKYASSFQQTHMGRVGRKKS